MAQQVLAGVKVLDLSEFVAGPYCTRILAGFGAEVIKVERPGGGDSARSTGPFLEDRPGPERSSLFLYLNGNKKSVTLNLKSSTGVRIFRELLERVDTVVESSGPGAMESLGLGYETLKAVDPRLVMTSVSGFGQTGPYRDYKVSQLVTWAMSVGVYTGNGYGSRPSQMGGWIPQYIAGLFAAVGTSVAIYQRAGTGRGQQVDVSMQESNLLASLQPATLFAYTGQDHNEIGGRGLGIYRCKDGGYIGPNAWTLAQRERMFALLGMPELIDDPRFQVGSLAANVDLLRDKIAEKVREWDSTELFETAMEWGVPFALVPTTKELLGFAQHEARGFFEEVDHPVMGKVIMPGAPFKMAETPWQARSPAPLLGEHNAEVYTQLGYTVADLVRLREQGVI